MGFGNPYGDPYSTEVVTQFAGILHQLDIKIISLADTIGISNTENISFLFSTLSKEYPQIEFGAHLHSRPEKSIEKIEAAYNSGCRRFDGAIKGYGGCPMAEDSLVGNIATEAIINFLREKQIKLQLNQEQFKESVRMAAQVFPA
jgi:hydroxymethylglutaryl-CoA lyase